MTSYRRAGVDLEGADRHVTAISSIVTGTWSDRVVGDFGGFAAGIELPEGYRRPVLMLSTDGVGTKLALAAATGRWTGVGHDLVAMCVDDLAAAGARPLAFVDYMAVGALEPTRDTAIVESVAAACQAVGAALLGGETAEHPGVMRPDEVDLAGAALGVVERGDQIDGAGVRPGDSIIAFPSPNLRSNGFSLVRQVFAGTDLDQTCPGEDASLGEVLLRPSVLYTPWALAAVDAGGVRGAAHITGGGIPGNLPRTLPAGCGAELDPASWTIPNVFRVISDRGGVGWDDMATTFNLGIGFCLVVAPDSIEAVLSSTEAVDSRVIGTVVEGGGIRFRRPLG
ncbi:MAG TPA: phosphoribosylformylglycinamidine cyclo-ligase [Acidimicrobiia bacterium]|nr:phosphoribosylformylglycinamidine cyclo-ligase [Acidimicrobiia bacterium]